MATSITFSVHSHTHVQHRQYNGLRVTAQPLETLKSGAQHTVQCGPSEQTPSFESPPCREGSCATLVSDGTVTSRR